MQEKNELLTLPEWQLEEQLECISEFLGFVHPSLIHGAGFRPCVELRPINRGEEDYMRSKSLMLWDLNSESINRLRTFLERHNGYPSCLFYSVFSYDNHGTPATGKKDSGKSKRIHAGLALGTSEIALDFDNITVSEYHELVDRFESLGIYAIWVFSGHGYQAHILLDTELQDKDILYRCVYKFRSKGFPCDPACVDPARLMRLPYTYNCKCFKDSAYAEELEEPPFCNILQGSSTRYALADIFNKLNTLPTVSPEDEMICLAQENKAEKATSTASGKQKKAQQPSENAFAVRKIEYPYISNYDLPVPVTKMLAYTPHGVRNKVLGYLIRLFKMQYRLSKGQIFEILSIWAASACEPAYDPDDLKTDFTRLYYDYNGLGYDATLAKIFGVIDHQEIITLRKKSIIIANAFFRDFNTLDGKVVRLYLAIKMLEHIEEPATVNKLSEILDISVRALRPTLQEFVASGHGFITQGNRRRGLPDEYHTHRGYSIQDGYMTFSYNDIKAYVTELFDSSSRAHGELKLYLWMRWKFYSGEIFMSQTNLGQNINVAQNTISGITRRLETKHFIKIRKSKKYNCFESCEYELLR